MKRFLKYDTEITKKENSPVDKNGLIKENIVGGGSSIQPDWNQNDSTQPDYVKNRPFYMSDPVETVLVEESTVTFAENNGFYMAQVQSTFEATVGEIYKVYWDGTVYECVCAVFNSYPVIGNLSFMGAGSDTGDPFLMLVTNGVGIEIYTADTSASHTFSISGFVPEVVKIDEKYLPTIPADKLPNIPADKLPAGEVTTLHINITAINTETMEVTFTADRTPSEMQQASANGPTWCVVSSPAGILSEEAVSVGIPPAWYGSAPAFGGATAAVHGDDGSNKLVYAVRQGLQDTWILDLSAFGS